MTFFFFGGLLVYFRTGEMQSVLPISGVFFFLFRVCNYNIDAVTKLMVCSVSACIYLSTHGFYHWMRWGSVLGRVHWHFVDGWTYTGCSPTESSDLLTQSEVQRVSISLQAARDDAIAFISSVAGYVTRTGTILLASSAAVDLKYRKK